MASKELIYKDDARRAVLEANPAIAYCIDNIKPVDAVEVVRCKDCKYREKSPWHDGYRCGNPYDGMASGVELRDNDFCSYGERREGE